MNHALSEAIANSNLTIKKYPPSPEDYAEEFQMFAVQTAAGYIAMATIVHRAKKDLIEAGQFDKFCEAINRDSKSSFIRKFTKIGELSELLAAHTEKLPDAWTTLYTIVQIDRPKLEELLVNGTISASMEGTDARTLVAQHKPPKAPSKSVKKFWYKCEIPFDVRLEPDDQKKLNDIINQFLTERVKSDVQPAPSE